MTEEAAEAIRTAAPNKQDANAAVEAASAAARLERLNGEAMATRREQEEYSNYLTKTRAHIPRRS